MEPIYRTDGKWVAVYDRGHLFSPEGDWLGFLVGRWVFAPGGDYLGFLSDDRRLLRRRRNDNSPARREPPSQPAPPRMPANVALAPLLRDLPFGIIDVFEEEGASLLYVSDTRPDMQ